MKKILSLMLAVKFNSFICFILSMILLVAGCGNKQSELEPVNGFEQISQIIYDVDFGISTDEYKKSQIHNTLTSNSFDMQFDNNDEMSIGAGYIDNYSSYKYTDYILREGSSVVFSAPMVRSEFVGDKLSAVSVSIKIIDDGGNVENEQAEVVAAFGEIAKEMGFVRQEDISSYRMAFTVKDGYSFGDGTYYDYLDVPIFYIGDDIKWPEYRSMTDEEMSCKESESVYVKADNDLIYYLSSDGKKALAIAPQDPRSERMSIYFNGDNIQIERYDGVSFDPNIHDYKDFNVGQTPETIYAPVVVTYYDIQSVRDNIEMFAENNPAALNDSSLVELLRDLQSFGTDQFLQEYKDVIDFTVFK